MEREFFLFREGPGVPLSVPIPEGETIVGRGPFLKVCFMMLIMAREPGLWNVSSKKGGCQILFSHTYTISSYRLHDYAEHVSSV